LSSKLNEKGDGVEKVQGNLGKMFVSYDTIHQIQHLFCIEFDYFNHKEQKNINLVVLTTIR